MCDTLIKSSKKGRACRYAGSRVNVACAEVLGKHGKL